MTEPTHNNVNTHDPRHEVLDKLIELYLGRGFGNVTKAELDTAFFDAILRTNKLADDAATSVAMRTLGISSAKYGRLKASLELKQGRTRDLDADLRHLLRTPATLRSGERIALHVDSALLRAHIRDVLHAKNVAVDGAFARELVVLNIDGYATLLATYAPTTRVAELQRALHLSVSDNLTDRREAISTAIAKAVAKQLGSDILHDLATEAISGSQELFSELIAWLLSG